MENEKRLKLFKCEQIDFGSQAEFAYKKTNKKYLNIRLMNHNLFFIKKEKDEGHSPLKIAQIFAEAVGDKLIVRCEKINGSVEHRFSSFPSIESFLNFKKGLKDECIIFHEYIYKVPSKPEYIEIEPVPDEDEIKPKKQVQIEDNEFNEFWDLELKSEVINKIREKYENITSNIDDSTLLEVFKKERESFHNEPPGGLFRRASHFEKKYLRVCSGTREGKISMHIIYRDLKFVSLKGIQFFVTKIFIPFLRYKRDVVYQTQYDKFMIDLLIKSIDVNFGNNKSMRIIGCNGYDDKNKETKPKMNKLEAYEKYKDEEFFITYMPCGRCCADFEFLEGLRKTFDFEGHLVNEDKIEKLNKQRSPKFEHYRKTFTREKVEKLLNMLSIERKQIREEWLKVCFAVADLGDDYYDIFDEWSSGEDNYDEVKNKRAWDSYRDKEGGIHAGSLHTWAEQDSPEEYQKSFRNVLTPQIRRNLFEGEKGHTRILFKYFKNEIIITEIESGSGYFWDKKKRLWEPHSYKEFLSFLDDPLEGMINSYKSYIFDRLKNEEEDKMKLEQKFKSLCKLSKSALTVNHSKQIFVRLSKILGDEYFIQKLNASSPHLLPIKKGKVINLKDGSISDRLKEHYFSLECNVELGNKDNENIKRFVEGIMPDEKERRYLQVVSGIFLTGETPDRELFIFSGESANGKSTWLDLMHKVLGEFYSPILKGVIFKDRGLDRHTYSNPDSRAASPHLMALIGKRFCCFSESEINDRLNEGQVKAITSGELIPARHLFGKLVYFKSNAKLALITNHKPTFNTSDEAIVERIRYLHFKVKFVSEQMVPRDEDLTENQRRRDSKFIKNLLDNHVNDFFAWCVEGAKIYYQEGLQVPDSVSEVQKSYVDEVDPIKQFFEMRVEKVEEDSIPLENLRISYNQWAKDEGESNLAAKTFSTILKKKGFDIRKGGPKKDRMYLFGYKLGDSY